MLSPAQPLEVAWLTADGQQRLDCRGSVQVEVAAGLLLDLGFAPQDPEQLSVRLTLSGERSVCGLPGKTNARYVIIPLNDAALLLGVAEPSAEPAALMPVPSTPVLLRPGGIRLDTRGGVLSVRGSQNLGVDIDFVPFVGDMNACVLRIRAVPGSGGEDDHKRDAPGLSILRIREDAVSVVAGRMQASRDAI